MDELMRRRAMMFKKNKTIVTATFTGTPTSYDTINHSWYSVSNMANGYTDSSSTTYATINNARGANAETYAYFTFDTLSIPIYATIESVVRRKYIRLEVLQMSPQDRCKCSPGQQQKELLQVYPEVREFIHLHRGLGLVLR